MLLPIRDVRALRLTAPALPSWAALLTHTDRAANDHAASSHTHSGHDWCLTTSTHWTTATITLPEAANMDAAQLQQGVAAAYLRLLAIVREHGDHQAVRFWNYLPRILDLAEADRDRYMVFNAGRHEALSQWFGRNRLRQSLVAASAVDHGGDDFEIHVLASDAKFSAIENPRQRPAHRYSPRYGPVPPSFARATLLQPTVPTDPLRLITAGTASVLGEDSRHHDDVARQLEETFINLAVLVAAASPGSEISPENVEENPALRRDLLGHYSHVRAYVPHAKDEAAVADALREMCVNAPIIELMPAMLCRQDLLVEIEAMAQLDSRHPSVTNR